MGIAGVEPCQQGSRVPIYTIYEVDDVDLRGDDTDSDVAEDGEKYTPPQATV
jgi:hypothetical protein